MIKSGVNKKYLALVVLGLVFSVLLINLIAAQSSGSASAGVVKSMGQAVDTIKAIINPIVAPLLGESLNSENLMAKLLFFIIVFCVVWLAMDRIPFFQEKGGFLFMIAFAASLLSIRVFSSAVIQTVLLPYEAFGITLTAGLPFALYFIVINLGLQDPRYKTIRRLAWVFFSVVFFILWVTRMDAAPPTGVNAEEFQMWLSIYPITALLGLLVASIDGTITRLFQRVRMDRMWAESQEDSLDNLKLELIRDEKLLKGKKITIDEFIKRKSKIDSAMKRIMKSI